MNFDLWWFELRKIAWAAKLFWLLGDKESTYDCYRDGLTPKEAMQAIYEDAGCPMLNTRAQRKKHYLIHYCGVTKFYKRACDLTMFFEMPNNPKYGTFHQKEVNCGNCRRTIVFKKGKYESDEHPNTLL